MSNAIEITWLGHACFMLEANGYSVVLDPYEDNAVPGLAPLRVSANEVKCSHAHHDHCGVAGVSIKEPAAPSPFELSEFETPHDDAGGAKRGMNTVRIFSACGMRVAHLGDIGRPLTELEALLLRGADALLVPVGGYYTIDARQAGELVDTVKPRVTIPMHYRGDGFGYPVIGTVDEFTKLFDEVSYTGCHFTLTPETPEKILVMSIN